MTVKSNLGVQSWCFRNFKSNDALIEQLKKLGITCVELCGVHVDFKNPATFDEVIAKYKAAGIAIQSIGVNTVTEDESASEGGFIFAKKAGCGVVAVSFPMKNHLPAFRVAEKLAAKYGVKTAIHNHGGHDWLGSTTALDYVFELTNEHVGLCLDTAWALDAGEDPITLAKKFHGRLYGVHVKDFIFDRKGKPEDVVVGTGNLDLPQLMKLLCEINFDGSLTLEYEGDVENPVPALAKCVAAIKKVLPF